jgi:hypothetical protein
MANRPYAHVDALWGGTLHLAEETWSVGMTLAPVDHGAVDISSAALQTLANALDARMRAWWSSSIHTIASVQAVYENCRVYVRPPGTGTATIAAESVPTALTGSGVEQMPTQVALVVTLLTGFAGRANRGRVYLPFQSSGPYLEEGDLAPLATDAATFIAGCRVDFGTANGAPGGPVVGNVGHPMTSVRIDNVPDTQRRRRDKVTATAVASAVVPVG